MCVSLSLAMYVCVLIIEWMYVAVYRTHMCVCACVCSYRCICMRESMLDRRLLYWYQFYLFALSPPLLTDSFYLAGNFLIKYLLRSEFGYSITNTIKRKAAKKSISFIDIYLYLSVERWCTNGRFNDRCMCVQFVHLMCPYLSQWICKSMELG